MTAGTPVKRNDHQMTSIELSIPLAHSNYQRTFDAEIDVLAENELLVRG
jgi:hypothetical protein